MRRLGAPARLAPWDDGASLRRFLDATRPSLHVIVETEFWPARLEALARRGIPSALISARLSPDHWPRTRRARRLYAPALSRLALLAPASAADRARFLELGASPAQLGPEGSLKWDGAPEPAPEEEQHALRAELGLSRSRRWLALGSVHPGEVGPLLGALAGPGGALPAGLVVAPRHPERFDLLAEECRAAGFAPHRASEGPAPEDATLVLLDRMGVLPRLYPLVDAGLLGGTFAEVGGHSPLEAAAAGRPLVAGPHTFQQTALVSPLEEEGALARVSTLDEAAAQLRQWTDDDAARQRAGDAARAVVERHRGLSERLVDALERWLP